MPGKNILFEATTEDTRAPSLGDNLRRIRKELGWSSIKMAEHLGITQSALSKIENNLQSMSYDRLYEISCKLGIEVSELFRCSPSEDGHHSVARLSLDKHADYGPLAAWLNIHYRQLAADVKDRLMVATYVEVRGDEPDYGIEVGEHPGERFVYVIEGPAQFHSQFYETYELHTGDSVYLDIRMRHRVSAPESVTARLLVVTASEDKTFMKVERWLASQGLSNLAELPEEGMPEQGVPEQG